MIRDYYEEHEFPTGEEKHFGDLAIYVSRA